MERKQLKRFRYNELNELVEDANGSWIDADNADAVMDYYERKIKELRYERTMWKAAYFELATECDYTKPLGKLQQCSDIADALKARARKLKEGK